CLDRYGQSVLADTIRAGRDPHVYTAAMLSGLEYEEFLALKKTDPARFKARRQAAKPVNFGVPGGLGKVKLSAYAKANYGVTMTLGEAEAWKQKLVTEVYPELTQYLADAPAANLAEALGTMPEALSAACFPLGEFPHCWRVLEKIVYGDPHKLNGEM